MLQLQWACHERECVLGGSVLMSHRAILASEPPDVSNNQTFLCVCLLCARHGGINTVPTSIIKLNPVNIIVTGHFLKKHTNSGSHHSIMKIIG